MTNRTLPYIAMLAALAACADQPTGLTPSTQQRSEVSLDRSSDARALPTEHSSHFTEAEASHALGNDVSFSGFAANSFDAYDSESWTGNHWQSAVHGLRRTQIGFPTDGTWPDTSYLVLSSGYAPKFDDRTYNNRYDSERFCGSSLQSECDAAVMEFPIRVGSNGVTLDLNYRMYSWDSEHGNDIVRVYVIGPDSVPVLADTATIRTEFGTKLSSELGYGPLRRVSFPLSQVNVASGGTILVRFYAADRGGDPYLDSGAVIDNLRIMGTDRTAPVMKNLTDPSPVAINDPLYVRALLDDDTTGASNAAMVFYSLNNGESWNSMAPADGLFDSSKEEAVSELTFSSPTVLSICTRGVEAGTNVSGIKCVEKAVYDPDGSYVAGSGRIDSPKGACRRLDVCTDTAGVANFGFSSRYMRGASVPEGRTRFTFRDGDFQFDATLYDWLVVSGKRGQFKGKGTVNGGGDYGFKLTAIDGDLASPQEPDRFRIKIWDRTNDEVVYDNEVGKSDDATPTTTINNGNIRIQ